MNELAPGFTLVVEESAAHHWVGTCGDILLVFAYEGSQEDLRHVDVGGRALERLSQRVGAPVRLLFVVAAHGKPPSAEVRGALAKLLPRLSSVVGRAAIVIVGTGFGAAVHRGALTGLLALVRNKPKLAVTSSLREGLETLLGAGSPLLDPLARRCEALAQGPAKPSAGAAA